ncbi:class F sortase [Streptomyces sp. ms191]|uniref:class F sortase n=1 Tax=unclassified Streptomyces TaxID=2593676 RepID=UPI0011CE6696|nr:class F sortase [Streptomyces sp. ms191]TXS28961.1 class F sortase [Streptomyces sp. ms191]
MAPRRSRSARRRRRLLRLLRTVVGALSLAVGGVWWAQGGEPPDPSASAAPAVDGQRAGDAPAARPGPPAGPAVRPEPAPKPPARPPRPARPSPAPLPASRATRLAIPAITIEAPVRGIGVDRSGRLGSPPVDNPRVVGWYARGATPGERGTAIFVGHRDTLTGPAIFLNLDSLTAGHTVRVARADGRVAVFTVDKVRTYSKAAFPDTEVYGSTGRPELRLLTCGGAFSPKTGYEANIVVFAHLTDVARRI